MELIERAGFLKTLQSKFKGVVAGEGHSILITGESGIGKTSLVKSFCEQVEKDYKIYQGYCDALFTPRPLAPLYDILFQLPDGLRENDGDITNRTEFFVRIFHKLNNQKEASLIIFEDIHWADEATLDFIKFLTRRITQLRCLFILTYRDNEIQPHHPLRSVLGQLDPDLFTRIQLPELSRQAVEKMAEERGYSGEDVYNISGGNPFYVNEILASYSPGVPDNVKDSVLSVYNQLDEKGKHVWQILSVLPIGLEIRYLEKMEPFYAASVEQCLDSKIMILKEGFLFFKHELYRRTIETSLSPFLRITLNKKILEVLRENFDENKQIERIIHHAKNANENELVVQYAPLAARQAAALGAHIEACKLYLSAIEYYQGNDNDVLIQFYEPYAYECHLTNQVKEAIIYTGKALAIWKEKNDLQKAGNCMRFLSRLWWLDGNVKDAKKFAEQAIEVLGSQPSSPAKAMAYSNMSQLKMVFDQPADCIAWGEKAIAIAKEVGDEKTLSHALNNVGCVHMNRQSSYQMGVELLQESLEIALRNSFHEHAARAYSNMASIALNMKNYSLASEILDEGIRYCEERGLDSSRSITLSLKSLLHLETGDWKKAYSIADDLLNNENHLAAFTIVLLIVKGTITMRTGGIDALPLLIDAATKAFETTELQRIIPSLKALLEYEWLTGKRVIKTEDIDRVKGMIEQSHNQFEKNEFVFWLQKARKEHLQLNNVYEGYDVSNIKKAQQAAAIWQKKGYPYGQALALFEGDPDDKREAIKIVQELGADSVYEKMKLEMRTSGIKKIPRGIRKITRSNPAHLTERELDVLQLLKEGLQNKEIGARLFISDRTVGHHISSIFFKLDVNSRVKAVQEAVHMDIIK